MPPPATTAEMHQKQGVKLRAWCWCLHVTPAPLLVRDPEQNRIEKQLIEDRRTQTRCFRQLSVLQIISCIILASPSCDLPWHCSCSCPGEGAAPSRSGRSSMVQGSPALGTGHLTLSAVTISCHRACSLVMELYHCVTLCTVHCVDCARTCARLPGAAVPAQYSAVQCSTVHHSTQYTHTSMHMLQHAPGCGGGHTELQPGVIGYDLDCCCCGINISVVNCP